MHVSLIITNSLLLFQRTPEPLDPFLNAVVIAQNVQNIDIQEL